MFSPPGRRTGRPLTGLKASGAGAGRSTAAFEPGERELRSKGREARTNRAFNYQEMMWFYSTSHNAGITTQRPQPKEGGYTTKLDRIGLRELI